MKIEINNDLKLLPPPPQKIIEEKERIVEPAVPPKAHESKRKSKRQHRFLFLYAVIGIGFALVSVAFIDHIVKNKNDYQKLVQGVETQATDNTEPQNSQFDTSGEAAKETPQIIFKNEPPQINASSYGIYYLDDETGKFDDLYTQHSDLTLPPASITKLMTAVVAIENYDLDMQITVPTNCVNLNGSSVGFAVGDVFTLQDLLYGLLVRSGADAACTIANIGNEQNFIQAMNRKADELGMRNTSFANEIGFDSATYQFSSVSDIKKLSEYALQYKMISRITGTKSTTLRELNSGRLYRVDNTNDLLTTIPGTVGLKTGYTEEAGECLAFLYENKGQQIMIVILGSQDRFGDTTKLLEWAKSELD